MRQRWDEHNEHKFMSDAWVKGLARTNCLTFNDNIIRNGHVSKWHLRPKEHLRSKEQSVRTFEEEEWSHELILRMVDTWWWQNIIHIHTEAWVTDTTDQHNDEANTTVEDDKRATLSLVSWAKCCKNQCILTMETILKKLCAQQWLRDSRHEIVARMGERTYLFTLEDTTVMNTDANANKNERTTLSTVINLMRDGPFNIMNGIKRTKRFGSQNCVDCNDNKGTVCILMRSLYELTVTGAAFRSKPHFIPYKDIQLQKALRR